VLISSENNETSYKSSDTDIVLDKKDRDATTDTGLDVSTESDANFNAITSTSANTSCAENMVALGENLEIRDSFMTGAGRAEKVHALTEARAESEAVANAIAIDFGKG